MFSPATRWAFVFRLRKMPPDLKKPKPFAIENLAPKVPRGEGGTPPQCSGHCVALCVVT